MTENETWRVAIDWIRFHSAEKNSQEQFDTVWADNFTTELRFDEAYEELWQLIEVIHLLSQTDFLDRSDTIQGILSAGIVEDLLSESGERFIGRVEGKAKSDPTFAKMLGGVWRNEMSDNVWARLQAVWDRRGWDGNPE